MNTYSQKIISNSIESSSNTRGSMLQRSRSNEKNMALQGKFDESKLSSNTSRGNSIPSSVSLFVRDVLKHEGQSLSQSTRAFMEKRFDRDFSHVRIHSGNKAATTALGISARAYTVGSDIVFGHGQYSPQTNIGRTLIAHELAHVVQQNRGGSVPGLAHEHDADNAAKQAMNGSAKIVLVRQASKINIVRSVNDWLESSRHVQQLSYSEIIGDIDEIKQWLGRQNSSTPESSRLEEALDLLIAEKNRKEKKSLGDRPKRRRSRRKKSARKQTTESPLRKPRILSELTSVQYETAGEVNEEVDLIIAWLAQDDVSSKDRSLLKNELNQLAPQFHQGREKVKIERQTARLQRVFDPSEDDGFSQLQSVTRVVQGIVQDPNRADVFLIFHEGEQIPISKQQITNLRKEMKGHFKRGESRTKSKMKEGFGFYQAQVEINEDSPIISSIAGWLGDSGDPFMAMTMRKAHVIANLRLLEKALATDNFQMAADFLAKAERKSNEISAAGRAFNESHIKGAGLAVSGLEFTRDVSFAIAGSIAAVVAAPVAAAGAAGAGLTGVTAFGVTTLGTGAVVGTGSAVVRGGSAGVGELASGSSLDDAAAATYKEGKRGLKEGVVAGVTGGAAHTLGTAFGVGREGIKLSSQLGRRYAAEGTADFIGGATDAALQGKGFDEIVFSGAKQATFAAPGTLVGSAIKNPGVRAAAETAVSSGTAFGTTLASGGSTDEAITSASIAAISSVAVRGAARNPRPNTGAQERAFASGKQARSKVDAAGRKIRSATSAVMIGLADPVPAFRSGFRGALIKGETNLREISPHVTGRVRSMDTTEPTVTRQDHPVLNQHNEIDLAQVSRGTQPLELAQPMTRPFQSKAIAHNEVDLPRATRGTASLELAETDTRSIQSRPSHNEIDLPPIPANAAPFKLYTGNKIIGEVPGMRARRREFGSAPSAEVTGTHRRKGLHFNELNAAEISAGVRLDTDPVSGQIKRIEYKIHPEAVSATRQTERSFSRDVATDTPQSRDSAYLNSGFDRGHLVQREGVRGDAAAERSADKWSMVIPMTENLNRGSGSPWRASENRAMAVAAQRGTVKVVVEPVYGVNPLRLSDGTPVPIAIRRQLVTSDGQVIEDISHLNQ